MIKWNIMIYLAGDNNLSEGMVSSLCEIENSMAGLKDNCISVQFDPEGHHVPVHRYVIGNKIPRVERITTSGDDWRAFMAARKKAKIGKRVRMELENSANPITLLYFIWWATQDKLGPEWKHMLVLSGHGSGFANDFLVDDTTHTCMTIPEMANVLVDARKIMFGADSERKIDILGMDSCLMSTAEVYDQVSMSAKFLVAAEGFEMNRGWPYGQMLQDLPDGEAEVASKLVKDYVQFCRQYWAGAQSVDLSACDLAYSDQLRSAMTGLAGKLTQALGHKAYLDALILAHWRAQTYKSDQYVDIVDFADCLLLELEKVKEEPASGPSKNDLKSACAEVIRTIIGKDQPRTTEIKNPKPIVLKSGYVGPSFQYSYGLSVYFPWSEVWSEYRKLNFAGGTNDTDVSEPTNGDGGSAWFKFLNEYVSETRAKPRPGAPLSPDLALLRDKRLPPIQGPAGAAAPGAIPDTTPGGKRSTPGANRSTPGANRSTPGANRSTPGANRGLAVFESMKNPPLDWRECDLLQH